MDNKTYPSCICLYNNHIIIELIYVRCKKCVHKPDSKPMNVNFKIKSFTFFVNESD